MREYHSMDGVVDLDNSDTYSYMPDNIELLHHKIYQEVGRYYLFVNYFKPNWDRSQIKRVNLIIERFSSGRNDNFTNIIWLKEILFLIQDEIENMC